MGRTIGKPVFQSTTALSRKIIHPSLAMLICPVRLLTRTQQHCSRCMYLLNGFLSHSIRLSCQGQEWGSTFHEYAVEHSPDYVAFVVDGKVGAQDLLLIACAQVLF